MSSGVRRRRREGGDARIRKEEAKEKRGAARGHISPSSRPLVEVVK